MGLPLPGGVKRSKQNLGSLIKVFKTLCFFLYCAICHGLLCCSIVSTKLPTYLKFEYYLRQIKQAWQDVPILPDRFLTSRLNNNKKRDFLCIHYIHWAIFRVMIVLGKALPNFMINMLRFKIIHRIIQIVDESSGHVLITRMKKLVLWAIMHIP